MYSVLVYENIVGFYIPAYSSRTVEIIIIDIIVSLSKEGQILFAGQLHLPFKTLGYV